MLQVGQIVQVLEIKQDKRGKHKVRHEQGWTPMKAPDGRPVLEPADAGGQPPPPQAGGMPPPAPAEAAAALPRPAAAPAAPAELPTEDENGELVFKLLKGPQGFGINIDERGVVIGYTGVGSPAEQAGVPVGTLLVRVNGDPVLGKAEVIGGIKAAGSAQVITFAFMTPQAFMERKKREEQPPVEEAEPPAPAPTPEAAPPMPEPPVEEEPVVIDEAPAAVESEAPMDGGLDFGDLQMMEDLASNAPAPVEVDAEPAEPVAGIRRGKKKKKKKDPEELARIAAEQAEAEAQAQAEAEAEAAEKAEAEAQARAQAEAEAEAARAAAAEAEALRLEQERVAAAEAARIAAEEEAKRLAMQTVSYKIDELKRRMASFNDGHAQLLQQISHQRAAIASDEAKLAGLEAEIEQAMAREDYDHADRVQSDVDTLKGRVTSGKQTLAGNEQRAKEHDAKKIDMLNQGVQLHAARVDELTAQRDEEMRRCGAFIDSYGGRLADAENQLRDITNEIGVTLKSASAEEAAVATEQESVDSQVDQRTEGIRAEKDEHIKTIETIDEQIAELERQIAAKQAERQTETNAISVIDTQVYEERQTFSVQLTDIAERTDLIGQKRFECESKKQAMETQWRVLEEYRISAQAHREQYAEVIKTLCQDTDAVQEDKSMLSFWLGCIEEDQNAEQGATHRQGQLKAKLTAVSRDLQEVESANSDFADGMRVLQTESTQLQAALSRYEQQLPDLEGQKTAAASTRNFKEASRLNGEIKRVQGEQEQATARLTALNGSIAQKESQNADVSMKLSALQKAVDVAEKAVHTDRLETLKSHVAKLKARVATADQFNAAFAQAQLDMATGEANEIAKRLNLETVDSVKAEVLALPQVAAVTADVVDLPAPVPRMTEEEATLVLRNFASQDADLNAQLEEAMGAEQYDLCDELTLKIDKLSQDKAAAQETLGDKAANASMSTEDAEKVVATYDADLAELEAGLEKAMVDEDYDQCDALQLQVDALKTKKLTADATLTGDTAPVESAAVGDLKSLTVAEVPQFELPPIPAFESSAPTEQPAESSMYDSTPGGESMYGGEAAGGSMYGDAAGGSMYGDSGGAGAGASLYDDAAGGGGGSMYDDAGGVGAGGSMYDDTADGGGGSSMYDDPSGAGAGASMYDDTGGGGGGASMYADTGGASMYDDAAAATGTGESMYGDTAGSSAEAAGGGFDFVSGADSAGTESGADGGGFGFIAGGDAAPPPAEAAEATGGFGFIGSSDSAAPVAATDDAVTSDAAAADGGGFSFIGGAGAEDQTQSTAAAGGGIYGSEPAAVGASMYDSSAAEGAANIYGELRALRPLGCWRWVVAGV